MQDFHSAETQMKLLWEMTNSFRLITYHSTYVTLIIKSIMHFFHMLKVQKILKARIDLLPSPEKMEHIKSKEQITFSFALANKNCVKGGICFSNLSISKKDFPKNYPELEL